MKEKTAENWNKFFEILWVIWIIVIPIIMYTILLIDNRHNILTGIFLIWMISISVKYVLEIGPNIY